MKTFRVTIIITGVIVAWLAINTAFAQEAAHEKNASEEIYTKGNARFEPVNKPVKRDKEVHKRALKHELRNKPVHRSKKHKHPVKEKQKAEMQKMKKAVKRERKYQL